MIKNASSDDAYDSPDWLASAALFEDGFSIDWVLELAQEKASRVLLSLEQGIRQGWLTRKGPSFFSFANLEERRKWLAHLSLEKKGQIHGRIIGLLLKELPDDDEKPLKIAPHLLAIPCNEEETCRWLIKAGDLYRRNFRTEEALKCYLKVLNDLSALHGPETDSLFTEAAINYSKLPTGSHDTTKVLSVLQEALIRAKEWGQNNSEALLNMHLAKNEWLLSNYSSALAYFKNGWSMINELSDPRLLRSATTFSTFFLFWQGRFREAIQIYEKSVSDIEKHPKGRFPLLAALTVAQCYGHIGQIAQGLGMLDAIRNHSHNNRDRYMEALATIAMGVIMLDMHRPDDAIQYVESAMKESNERKNEWIQMRGNLILSFAYYLKDDNQQSLDHLHAFLQQKGQIHVSVEYNPYLMELCLAMEQGRLPRILGLSLEEEIQRMMKGENLYMKGIAYRHRAFLQNRQGLPPEKAIQSLNVSLKWLEESGHQIELVRSQLELSRQYLSLSDEEKARELSTMASNILYSFDSNLIPDDLTSLISNRSQGETLLKEIFGLGQEIVTLRDIKELVQKIISTVNRITGAEKGSNFPF